MATTEKKDKPVVYMGVCARRIGPSYLHPIVEIGIAYGTKKEDIVRKHWLVKCNDETEDALINQMADSWQQEYNESRWDYDQDEDTAAKAKPAKVVYTEVADVLNEVTTSDDNRTVVVLHGDVAEIAHLDFWLLTTGNRFLGCGYDVNGKELRVENPHTNLRKLPRDKSDIIEESVTAYIEGVYDTKKTYPLDDAAAALLLLQFGIDAVSPPVLPSWASLVDALEKVRADQA